MFEEFLLQGMQPFAVGHALDGADLAALGFRGKACIHPAQLETINRVFAPSESEIEWARRVIDAFESQSEGVLAVNGTMVDKPVVERARRVLREADA